MKRRLIQYSIILIMFTGILYLAGKLLVNFPEQYSGNDEPVKSTVIWALLCDAPGTLDEAVEETEQHSFPFALSVSVERWFIPNFEFCCATLPVLKNEHIPLHLSDSSPPFC